MVITVSLPRPIVPFNLKRLASSMLEWFTPDQKVINPRQDRTWQAYWMGKILGPGLLQWSNLIIFKKKLYSQLRCWMLTCLGLDYLHPKQINWSLYPEFNFPQSRKDNSILRLFTSDHELTNYIDTNAKCRHLKDWPKMGLCRRCLSMFLFGVAL